MMKKMIRKMINWAQSSESASEAWSIKSSNAVYANSIGSSKAVSSSSLDSTETPFNFTIYNANGGKVIQCYHYDKIKDRQISNLYLIHNNDNFAEELTLILTKESLAR